MRKRSDIITIISAIVFVVALAIGEVTGTVTTNFNSPWFYICLMLVVLAVVFAWMDLKGKFKSRNTELAKSFYYQGVQFKAKGDLNSAISNFKMALRLAPDFFPAHQAIGEVLLLKGKHSSAAKHLLKAQELDFKETDIKTEAIETSISFESGIFTSDKYGFSMTCPKGWKVIGGKESRLTGGDFVIEFLERNAHIHIIVGRTDDKSIEDTESNAIRNIHRFKGNLESFKRIHIDGIEAIEAIYGTRVGTKIKKVGLISDGMEFVITCGTKNTKAAFTQYEPVFDKCLQSLHFNKVGNR